MFCVDMWLFYTLINEIIILGEKVAMRRFEDLQKLVSTVDKNSIYDTICKNIKKFRVEKYNEFKNLNSNSSLNPYSTEHIAALLDYNHNHYKRFESETDSTKHIPLEKIIMLAIILEKNVDDFLK